MLVWLIWLFIIVLALFDCLRQHLWLRREGSDLFGYQLLLVAFWKLISLVLLLQVVFSDTCCWEGWVVVWLFSVVIGCLWLFFLWICMVLVVWLYGYLLLLLVVFVAFGCFFCWFSWFCFFWVTLVVEQGGRLFLVVYFSSWLFFFVFSWFWSVWLFWATLVVGQGGRCGDWGEGKAARYLSGNSTHFNVGPRLSSIDDDFINEFDDLMTLFMSHCIKNTLLEAYFQPFIQFTCKIG